MKEEQSALLSKLIALSSVVGLIRISAIANI